MGSADDQHSETIRRTAFAMHEKLRGLTLEDRLLSVSVLLLATAIPNGITIDALCDHLRALHERSVFQGINDALSVYGRN